VTTEIRPRASARTHTSIEVHETIPEALEGSLLLAKLDDLVNWGRANSLWPMFFGLSCCFVELATSITSRHDISRFGAEVMRGSPRQADLMVIAGTVFKKVAPALLRLYEQMLEPRWVISMGSCSNSGGMYDVYSVVQGVDTLLPVDGYIQGCPPRPESVMEALMLLQKKIKTERPFREVLRRKDGTSGTIKPPRIVGVTTTDDPRGPGLEGTRPRGTIMRPNSPLPAAYTPTWTPPSPVRPRIEALGGDDGVAALEAGLREKLGGELKRDSGEYGPTDTLTWRVRPEQVVAALEHLKHEATPRFRRLEYAAGIDNRPRGGGFRAVYHLTALEPGKPQVRVAVDLNAENPKMPTTTGVFRNANWYEREMIDMFGIGFDGHPDPRRLYMPSCWKGHPLRKDHPYRGTEMKAFDFEDAVEFEAAIDAYPKYKQEEEGTLIMSMGPNHPATHGVIRLILKMDGENVDDVDIDCGYHHRGPEKIAERQTYHKFIPYTDRIDYVSGVQNNFPYVLSVERLLGVEVPARAQMIRVMMAELYRIVSHQVYLGTFAQDAGALTPVFFTFEHREQILDFMTRVTGARMHASWFRIGGVAQDLPDGWRAEMEGWLQRFPNQLREVEKLLTGNPIFVGRLRDTGGVSIDDAIEMGLTGPNIRAAGLKWDVRRAEPYSGYEQYEFDVPTATTGDNYDRYLVHIAEMWQSYKIIEQCVKHIPDEGDYVAPEYRYAVPDSQRMLYDIESLIHHFVNVSRGFVPPAAEAYVATESSKGEYGYHVISDGSNLPYRVYIRTSSMPSMQALPMLTRGDKVSDLVITLGGIDFVLGDIDK
jgi:NADH-quinone oxidoreductase subunit B/C/D